LRNPPPTNPPSLNLDNDTAGDLNAGTYNVTFTIPGVVCQDTDNDRTLNLPNCTSWHSNQGTVSNIADAFTFKPDTKSKCVCDDTFEVPVTVEDATISVDKTASPTQINEPGGQVTFTVKVTNTSTTESIIIASIIDNPFGNKGTGATSADNTCPGLIGQSLAPQASASCYFKDDVWGNADDGEDRYGNGQRDAAVHGLDAVRRRSGGRHIARRLEHADVDKSVTATSNCSMDAAYTVVVNNASEVDKLTLNSLNDDKFGSLTSVHGAVVETTCSVPQTIDTNNNYTCTFKGRITGDNCEITHKNVVTADVTDDDNKNSKPTDDATVVLTTTP
jgi:hypothetical protein